MDEKPEKKKYLYPHPISGKMVSRQCIYQYNRGLNKKCIVCGKPSVNKGNSGSYQFCGPHLDARRESSNAIMKARNVKKIY